MLTRRENVYLIKRNLAQLIHDNGHNFAGLTTSLPDTTSVIQGVVPQNMLTSQVDIISALYRGWKYVIGHRGPLTLNVIQQLNKRASPDNLDPGHFRYQPASITGVNYKPPLPTVKAAKRIIKHSMTLNAGYSTRAISLMLGLDRAQLFWDGNKRTGMLAANYYLLWHHAGVLNIPTRLKPDWIRLLSNYYETGEPDKLIKWLNSHCMTTSLGSYPKSN